MAARRCATPVAATARSSSSRRRRDATRLLSAPGLGLGLDRGARFDKILREDEVQLAAGDVFVFFTDGVSEAFNSEAELFGSRA